MKTMFLAAAAATAMLVAAPAMAAPAAKDKTAQSTTTQSDTAAPPAAAKPMKKPMKHTSIKRTKPAHHKHMSRMDQRHYGRMEQPRYSRMDQPRYDRSATYRDEWNRPMNSGFAPLDFAGNVVGGAVGTAGAIAGTAVGTAGAIATAPFGGGPYAYEPEYAYNETYDAPYTYNGTAMLDSRSYAARNGFVCQPGTWFKNANGQRQICQ
ncbi:MAG: hypothetical protein J0H71_08180 [Rhizobiales bacterium]|nr:hypothetical protein [Hyphomicrobiales bacterium]